LTNPPFKILKNKTLKSGFDLFIDDFDLEADKEKHKPKQSFINKLLGKKRPDKPLFTADIDDRIKDCKKVLTVIWDTDNSFNMRFAALTKQHL
jgi:hypothetical protein